MRPLTTFKQLGGQEVQFAFADPKSRSFLFGRFVTIVRSVRLASRSFVSMWRSGLSLPIAIHFMAYSLFARWALCPAPPARKS